jgi:hypothetical protein
MVRGWRVSAALLAAALCLGASRSQFLPPLEVRLRGLLVDLYRPKFILGFERVSRGFVATGDGLILAPLDGLQKAEFGAEVRLRWSDGRSAEGWLVWKDRELGFTIVRLSDPLALSSWARWRPSGQAYPKEVLYGLRAGAGGLGQLEEFRVEAVHEVLLRSGRRMEVLLLKPSSTGKSFGVGPLLDGSGQLVAVVTGFRPSWLVRPGQVVGFPIGALEADLAAARRMRPPEPVGSPVVVARPRYRVGVGIGSGGVRPSFGLGYATPGSFEPPMEDPWLRRKQAEADRAKTEALLRALESQAGLMPQPSAAPLTNSEPIASSGLEASSSSGKVRELRPEEWTPKGSKASSQLAKESGLGKWPVVVEPKVVRPRVKSLEELERELDELKARAEALEQELRELRRE